MAKAKTKSVKINLKIKGFIIAMIVLLLLAVATLANPVLEFFAARTEKYLSPSDVRVLANSILLAVSAGFLIILGIPLSVIPLVGHGMILSGVAMLFYVYKNNVMPLLDQIEARKKITG